MSFFFNEAKQRAPAKKAAKAPARRGVIPIASLQELGCSVCPRDQDDSLESPKMKPSGQMSPDIYLLGASPSADDDFNNNHWTNKAGDYIYKTFGANTMEDRVRSNYITQCAGPQTEVEIACCRNRIVQDIEETKPHVIVTVGDAALSWVMQGERASSALVSTGTWIATRVGKHSCWVVPLIEPRFLEKKGGYGPSGHQLMLESVVKDIKSKYQVEAPKIYHENLKDGLELITGENPGDLERVEQALNRLRLLGHAPISIDIETNGLRPRILENPLILTVSVGTFEDTVAFPLDHPEQGWGSNFQKSRVWDLLIAFLTDCGPRVAHHAGFEMEWLEYFTGAKLIREHQWEDTMAQCHTLDERGGTKSLDYQCRTLFGFWLKALCNLDVKRLLDYPILRVLEYNALDVKWDHKVYTTLKPKIEAIPEYQLEYERKVRLAPTLVITQAHGVYANVEEAKRHNATMEGDLQTLERKISRTPEVKDYESRFGRFSPTASDQVLKLMRDICKRQEVFVEDHHGRRETTDESALASIPDSEVPSAKLILEHRGLAKLSGTYLMPVISRRILSPSGFVHSQYGSMVAVTGRLNSEDPNLQNWPKRKHKQIRSIFEPRPGNVYGACDYGQIEFRVVGMASEDPNLVKACWNGYDVHKFWAERIVALYPKIKDQIASEFSVDWDESGLKLLRQESKNKWVFPQLFGSSVKSCIEGLNIPKHIGDKLAAEFWDEFRVVKRWQEKLLKKYERDLYVETLGGRRRRGAMTKNEIINMPIQGTAADIVTEGMCAVSERAYVEDDPALVPAFNVHDDLTFEWPTDPILMEQKKMAVVEEMCRIRFDWINVPLMVEVSTGPNWADLTEIGKFTSTEVFNLRNPYA